MNEVMILYTCDAWKSVSSRHTVGAFTDEILLKNMICEMFEKDLIEFRGLDFKTIKKEANEGWDDYYENPELYDEDMNVEYEIALDIEKRKEKIFDEIADSSVRDLNTYCDYIYIETLKLNPTELN